MCVCVCVCVCVEKIIHPVTRTYEDMVSCGICVCVCVERCACVRSCVKIRHPVCVCVCVRRQGILSSSRVYVCVCVKARHPRDIGKIESGLGNCDMKLEHSLQGGVAL